MRLLLKSIWLAAEAISDLFRALYDGWIKRKAKAATADLAAKGTPIKLDLGCGPVKSPGFTGINLSPNADIQWDLTWGLPFADNSVTEIKSDHFFEHLALPDVSALLKECKRVLATGGILNFSIPHIDPYLDAYLRKDFPFLKEKIYDVPEGQEILYGSCFDRLSWLLLRSGEHRSMFDKDSISAKVKLAGFSKVETRNPDEHRDKNSRFSSIYVTASK